MKRGNMFIILVFNLIYGISRANHGSYGLSQSRNLVLISFGILQEKNVGFNFFARSTSLFLDFEFKFYSCCKNSEYSLTIRNSFFMKYKSCSN